MTTQQTCDCLPATYINAMLSHSPGESTPAVSSTAELDARTQRWPVIWRERLIGFMVKPHFDLWLYFGKWEEADVVGCLQFKQVIQTTGEAEVLLNGERGMVLEPPATEIAVMLDDCPQLPLFPSAGIIIQAPTRPNKVDQTEQ